MARPWLLLVGVLAALAAVVAILWWLMGRAKAAGDGHPTAVLEAVEVERTEGTQQPQADGALVISPPPGVSEPWLTSIKAKIPLVLHFGTSVDPMKPGENYGVSVNPALAIHLRRDGADVYQTEEKVV